MITASLLLVLLLVALGYALCRFNNYCERKYGYQYLSGWNVLICSVSLVALFCSMAPSSPEAPFLLCLGVITMVGQMAYLWIRTSLPCATIGMLQIITVSAAVLILAFLIILALADRPRTRTRM